jgi:hypothetical protein
MPQSQLLLLNDEKKCFENAVNFLEVLLASDRTWLNLKTDVVNSFSGRSEVYQ